MTESTPKPNETSRASKPRKKATRPAPKPGAKAKPEAKRAIGDEASRLIDDRIQSVGGWRAETLAEVRRVIREADPDIVEEWKWMGTPVWSHAGNVCTGETYKQVVKLTFARGASLKDPRGLFNSSLDGNTRRAIDIREGEMLDGIAFKTLILAAIAENLRSGAARSGSSPKGGAKSKALAEEAKPARAKKGKQVVLLSGGNPQIAKGEGDAPVQAYIAALPGWKSDLARRIDALIVQNVPNVHKAVKWNSPMYGVEGEGWFLGLHTFTGYLKLAFFHGTSLQPVPPGTSKSKDVRYLDIREDDPLDEAQLAKWVKQAAALPGRAL
jgi:hypothetical protein